MYYKNKGLENLEKEKREYEEVLKEIEKQIKFIKKMTSKNGGKNC